MVHNNVFGATTPQTVTYDTASTYFTVTASAHANAPPDPPAAYPFIHRGTHFGFPELVTADSGFPVEVHRVRSAPITWSIDTTAAETGDQMWNAAYESFFSSTGGIWPDKTEIMIWLDHQNMNPGGAKEPGDPVEIGGHLWEVWHATPWQGWEHYVAYRRVEPINQGSISLDVKHFIDDSIRRGWLDPNSFMDNMEAGFEIYRGGAGLTSESFSADLVAPASGTVSYWDTNELTPGAGGAGAPGGNWNGTTPNFNTDATGAGGGSLHGSPPATNVVVFSAGSEAIGTYTVNVTGTQSAAQIVVEHGNVTLAGGTLATGAFDVAAGANLAVTSSVTGGPTNSLSKTGGGTLALAGASTHTGPTAVNAGTLVMSQGLKSGGALSIADGAKAVVPATSPDTFDPPAMVPSGTNNAGSKLSSISIVGSGQLDLNNNDMVIDHDGSLDIHDFRELIGSGYDFGAQDGPGIISTTALNTDPFTFALGYADNAFLPLPYGSTLGGGPFAGFDVDDTAALIKFTWVGDVTLDGVFDFQDLSIFNGNYDAGASTGRVWTDGDLNYDGVIDFQDLSLFNGTYDPSKPSLPEPGALAWLGVVVAAGIGRRVRTRSPIF